jgi:hypothetical protein
MNDNQSNDLAEMMCRVTAATVAFDALSPAEREAVLRMQVETLERLYGQPKDGLAAFMERHKAWIERTFPRNATTEGITRHIEKECAEVREKPDDLDEWIDILILGIHGYWRNGGTAEDLLPRLNRKLTRNESRRYVVKDDPNEPIEHDRTGEVSY